MIKVVPKQKQQEDIIPFSGFPLGENTNVPSSLLDVKELAECIDFNFNPGGQLETRRPFTLYTDTIVGTPRDVQSCSLSGTQYEIGSDEDTIYYLSATSGTGITPISIDTVAGPSQITPYQDVAIISDGSYLKYCDSTTSVKLCYDGGDGSMYDNYAGDLDGTVTITTSGTGVTFTTPAWDTGFTIPPTDIYFYGVGSAGTGTIGVEIFNIATSATVATTSYTGDIPTTSADYLQVSFASTDITAEFTPSTAYRALLKGTLFNLSHTTVATGGTMVTGGSTLDLTKNPVMMVQPGLPPKSSWSVVSGTRLRVYDSTKPGGLWYGNLSYLDWSTTDGGGWQGVSDQDYNSFKVGAAQDLYGTLYVYGTEENPYIAKWTGDTPSEYAILPIFQQSWSTQRTLVNTNNDLWSANRIGVDPLTGVTEYGDLRTYSASDPIRDRFSNWVTSTAFAGYNAKNGQYWLYMPTYSDYISVCHTKQPYRMQNGQIRFPWSRYKPPATPTCFSQVDENFLMGADDGYFYKLDASEYKDLTTDQIYPSFKTSYIELPTSIDLAMIQFIARSFAGSTFSLDIYVNGNEKTSINTYSHKLPMSDALTVDQLIMDIDDMIGTLDVQSSPPKIDLNINCWSFQIKISNIFISGYPVYFSGALVKYKREET